MPVASSTSSLAIWLVSCICQYGPLSAFVTERICEYIGRNRYSPEQMCVTLIAECFFSMRQLIVQSSQVVFVSVCPHTLVVWTTLQCWDIAASAIIGFWFSVWWIHVFSPKEVPPFLAWFPLMRSLECFKLMWPYFPPSCPVTNVLCFDYLLLLGHVSII